MKSNLQIGIEQQRAAYEFLYRPLLSQIAQTHGISVRDFAEIFGISKSHAEEIMNHKKMPALDLALRITRYFECTVEELFGWRVDDNGERRPLLIELSNKKLIRLTARDKRHSAIALMGAVVEEMRKHRELEFKSGAEEVDAADRN